MNKKQLDKIKLIPSDDDNYIKLCGLKWTVARNKDYTK